MMNTKKIILLSGLMVLFLSLSSFKSGLDLNETFCKVETQDGLVVYAVYDGKTDAGYNFIVTDRKGKKQALSFQNAVDSVLTAFDLNAETFVGTMFKITFNQAGDETKMISKLEKVQVH